VLGAFELITEEFVNDLGAIRQWMTILSSIGYPARLRIASSNAATLLVAATFEEYIREMAREYARFVVTSSKSLDQLPSKLTATAWRRTLEKLARMKMDDGLGREGVFGTAQARFSVVYEFCNGDLSKDIYMDLIHNENNMRHDEINSMFKVSGFSNVCGRASETKSLKDYFGEFETSRTHGKLRGAIDDFIDRRNQTAHELSRGHSGSSDQILRDIDLLEKFGHALNEILVFVADRSGSKSGSSASKLEA
jgi:hypothetical protein